MAPKPILRISFFAILLLIATFAILTPIPAKAKSDFQQINPTPNMPTTVAPVSIVSDIEVETAIEVDNSDSNSITSKTMPQLDTFIGWVENGQDQELRGLYIPNILAALIVQQPEGNAEFVSPRQNVITQYSLASQFGSVGLLAHNYLAGDTFSMLTSGQSFYLVYGDGHIKAFVVKEILRYQSLQSNDVNSNFVDLENGQNLTSQQVFSKVYNRAGQVILQTCIDAEGDQAWGRLFLIAEPYIERASVD